MPAPGTGIMDKGRIGGVIDVGPISPIRPPAPTRAPISNAPTSLRRRPPTVGLYLETGLETDEFGPIAQVSWRQITYGMDGSDTTAQLSAGLDAEKLSGSGQIGNEHFDHLIERFSPDRRVRIAQRLGIDTPRVFFQGYPQVPSFSWSERSQSLNWLCIDEGQERLRTHPSAQIYGRFMRYDPLKPWDAAHPDAVLVEALPTVFNAGNRPNRSPEAFPFEIGSDTHNVHLFVDEGKADAHYWSFADALRYLVFCYALGPGIGVNVRYCLIDTEVVVDVEPAPSSPDPFIRRITAKAAELSVAGVNLDEALALLASAAGLHYEIVVRNIATGDAIEVEHYLRFFAIISTEEDAAPDPFRLMSVPKVHDIPREAPFTDMTGRRPVDILASNRMIQSSITYDRRAINAPIILAGRKWYEVTLLLRPGWLPSQAAGRLDNLFTESSTPAEQQAARTAALAFWENQFPPNEHEHESGTRLPHSIYHGLHPQHPSVFDIGRLWIFPDSARYMISIENGVFTSAYARAGWPAELYSPYDPSNPAVAIYVRPDIGAGLADAAQWVPRARPFRNTIGRAGSTSDPAPIVKILFEGFYWGGEFSYVPERWQNIFSHPNWVEVSGGVHIDEDRAAIRFTDANLWRALPFVTDPEDNDSVSMLEAYINGFFMVAVTCTIPGDERLKERPLPMEASFFRRRGRLADTGLELFQFRSQTAGNSLLQDLGPDGDPRYRDRDDSAALARYAAREAELVLGDVVSGTVEIPWFDWTYRVGDSFAGVEGLALRFNRYAEIIRRELVNDPEGGQRTVLHLSDLRGSPEVDSE